MASSSARSRAAAAADAVAAELRATAAAHDFISPADAAAAPPSVMDRMIRDLDAKLGKGAAPAPARAAPPPASATAPRASRYSADYSRFDAVDDARRGGNGPQPPE